MSDRICEIQIKEIILFKPLQTFISYPFCHYLSLSLASVAQIKLFVVAFHMNFGNH